MSRESDTTETVSALDRCIAVSVAEFAADHWGKRALLSSAADLGTTFDDLFSTEAADELLSVRGLRTPFIRMAKEGSVLAPSAFTAPGGYGAEVGDQVSSEKVLAEFAAGSTIVLQGLHRTWPPLQEFTRRLVAELGHPAQVNAYITPASSRGFDPHYDVHDVFVLQIAGQKRWVIHEPVHELPFADEPWGDRRDAVAAQAAGEPAIDTVLSPGDALYLPRGWLHSATALVGTTIHLTIGMPAVTRADLARDLIGRALRSDRLRASLPLGIDLADPAQIADDVRAAAEDLIASLQGAADGSSVDEVAVRVGSRFRRSTRAEPVRPLHTVEVAAGLAGSDRVRWRDELHAVVREDAGQVAIVLPSKTVRLPVVALSAVQALHGGETLAVGSLPALDEDDAVVVVRRLLREGVLVPVP
ncbi:cupin domain-containing protein [Curtobacterium sp. SL109]|uniref:cupin domain-containing protein n=1 Tax=Curtobacterium sp. SL109 TaxID=2994662 RepID=UPI0022743D07|nr:cupin domain-containing protein [Curtobacterium sp. SL109]MCY1695772.1 cupin-like domain-containing protein [Curtobacterium sp. SL109]